LSEDLRGLRAEDLVAYQKAKVIATEALSEGYKAVLPRNVISFHSVAITPHWASNMKKYSTIGSHAFYSFKRKG
jgi:hypothetical protein